MKRSLPWSDVVEVRPAGGHRVFVRFEDGVEGVIDLARVIEFTGVFAPLADPAVFARVRLYPDGGTICWPNGADIAPETLYAAVTGRPIEGPGGPDESAAGAPSGA